MKKGTMNSPNAVTIVQVGSNDQYVLCDDLFVLFVCCGYLGVLFTRAQLLLSIEVDFINFLSKDMIFSVVQT